MGINDPIPNAPYPTGGQGLVLDVTGRLPARILGSGTPDSSVYLRGDSMWQTGTGLTYTPLWTASGVAPVLGNGTLSGRYMVVGKIFTAYIDLSIGTTTTLGTGNWAFSLPVTSTGSPMGTTLCFQGGNFYFGFAQINSATTIVGYSPAAPGALVGAAAPFAWANGNIFRAQIQFEQA